MDQSAVRLKHNLDGKAFMWLWAKYVGAVNDKRHCTASLRGPYSKRLSRHNPGELAKGEVVLDEVPPEKFKAIYVCGVARAGYAAKKNYPFNLHAAILPQTGARGHFAFEGWELTVENGLFLPIPKEVDLPMRYRALPPEFTTCRIFRWAVCAARSQYGIKCVKQIV